MKPSKIIAIILTIIIAIGVITFAFIPLFIALSVSYIVACLVDTFMGDPSIIGKWNILKIFDKK